MLRPVSDIDSPPRITESARQNGQVTRIHQPSDVVRLLMEVQELEEPVYLLRDDGTCTLSALRCVDDQHLELTIPDAAQPYQLPASGIVEASCWLQRISLSFKLAQCTLDHGDGMYLLTAHLPSEVFRLQRRDFFRFSLTPAFPLSCFLHIGDDDYEISLIDLSLGGIGILGYVPGVCLDAGTIYQRVRIELPDNAGIVADIEIRNSYEVTLKNGIRTIRTGARFINLPGTTQSVLQRYINRMAREDGHTLRHARDQS
ncbi:PilZ domain-containing protein [Burkholderiaceae bacterium DAT-1]|nr:PilZ domain-containing protein [Burkholderiaceae bacterium DAT-1]